MATKEMEALEREIAEMMRTMEERGLQLPPGLKEIIDGIVSPSRRDDRGAEPPRE